MLHTPVDGKPVDILNALCLELADRYDTAPAISINVNRYRERDLPGWVLTIYPNCTCPPTHNCLVTLLLEIDGHMYPMIQHGTYVLYLKPLFIGDPKFFEKLDLVAYTDWENFGTA